MKINFWKKTYIFAFLSSVSATTATIGGTIAISASVWTICDARITDMTWSGLYWCTKQIGELSVGNWCTTTGCQWVDQFFIPCHCTDCRGTAI